MGFLSRLFYMSDLTEQMEADLIAIEGDIQPDEAPKYMAWGNDTYPVRAGIREEADILEEGGKVKRIEQTLWVRRSLFLDGRRPKSGQKLEFEGTEMRIESIRPSPDQIDYAILAIQERA